MDHATMAATSRCALQHRQGDAIASKNANHVKQKLINATRLTVPYPLCGGKYCAGDSTRCTLKGRRRACSSFGRFSRATLGKRSAPVSQP